MILLGAGAARALHELGIAPATWHVREGASAQAAIERPRIHAESDAVLVDARWPESTVDELREAGFEPQVLEEEPTTWYFGRPAGITIDADGTRHGGADPLKPHGVVPE